MWHCKECNCGEIFRVGYVKGTIQQENFDKNGRAHFEEPIDLDVTYYENYECSNCGSNAETLEELAYYIKEEKHD